MTHPSHAHFILFCEEGLPSGMFLSGGKLTNESDSALIKNNIGVYQNFPDLTIWFFLFGKGLFGKIYRIHVYEVL